jgi:hypothetical protein
MATFDNLNDISKFLNQKIKIALEQDVKKEAIKTMQREVVETVYDQYVPTEYQRTGGLYQERNIKGTMISENTLEIENVRKDEKTGRYVAPIVEEGTGYTWKGSEIYEMQPFPRPFVEETAKALDNGLAKDALRKGLKNQGLDVT